MSFRCPGETSVALPLVCPGGRIKSFVRPIEYTIRCWDELKTHIDRVLKDELDKLKYVRKRNAKTRLGLEIINLLGRHGVEKNQLKEELIKTGQFSTEEADIFAFYFKNLKSYFKEESTKAINNMTIILLVFVARFCSRNILPLTKIEMIKYFVLFLKCQDLYWKTRSLSIQYSIFLSAILWMMKLMLNF